MTEIDPTDHDWQTNKAGHKVSHHYGFGLLDAGRAVYAAKHWVPWSDAVGLASGELKVDEKIAPSDIVSRSWHVTKEMFANIDDLVVEHVEVNMTVTTDFRYVLFSIRTNVYRTVLIHIALFYSVLIAVRWRLI